MGARSISYRHEPHNNGIFSNISCTYIPQSQASSLMYPKGRSITLPRQGYMRFQAQCDSGNWIDPSADQMAQTSRPLFILGHSVFNPALPLYTLLDNGCVLTVPEHHVAPLYRVPKIWIRHLVHEQVQLFIM